MKILTRFLGFSSIAVMLFVFTATACAQLPDPGQGKMEKKWEARFTEIVKELGFSADQQQAMALQHSQERARARELRQKTKVLRDRITEELNKEATDTAKVNALVGQLKDLTGQRIEEQIQGILALKKILTPEQFKALNEKRKKDDGRRKRGGRHE